jgi:hypothetical protein
MVVPGQVLDVNLTSSGDVQPSSAVLNGLDAGPWIRIRGSTGERQIQAVSPGSYSDIIGQSIPGLLEEGFLDPGSYTIDNGDGGSEVGAFSFPVEVTTPVAWTNSAEVNTVARTQDLTITWSNADSSAAVSIIGFSAAAGGAVASFQCSARSGEGQFTVPASVLRSLPASRPAALPDVSGVVLVSALEAARVVIPGVDVATSFGGTVTGKVVSFR